jgi:methylase of polypeptide subunit release factors
MSQYPAESYLDIGTGSGVHAIMRHADVSEIFAIDTVQRCCDFSTFNSVLNSASSINVIHMDCRSVSRLGKKFDLITCQPPYAPDHLTAPHTNYWSGGPMGDDVLNAALSAIVDCLSVKGTAIIATLLCLRKGEQPIDRVAKILPSNLRVALDGDYCEYQKLSSLINPSSYEALAESWLKLGIDKFWKGTLRIYWTPEIQEIACQQQ